MLDGAACSRRDRPGAVSAASYTRLSSSFVGCFRLWLCAARPEAIEGALLEKTTIAAAHHWRHARPRSPASRRTQRFPSTHVTQAPAASVNGTPRQTVGEFSALCRVPHVVLAASTPILACLSSGPAIAMTHLLSSMCDPCSRRPPGGHTGGPATDRQPVLHRRPGGVGGPGWVPLRPRALDSGAFFIPARRAPLPSHAAPRTGPRSTQEDLPLALCVVLREQHPPRLRRGRLRPLAHDGRRVPLPHRVIARLPRGRGGRLRGQDAAVPAARALRQRAVRLDRGFRGAGPQAGGAGGGERGGQPVGPRLVSRMAACWVALASAGASVPLRCRRLFYLSLPPSVFLPSCQCLSRQAAAPTGWTRVIVEKPFGRDLSSYQELDR